MVPTVLIVVVGWIYIVQKLHAFNYHSLDLHHYLVLPRPPQTTLEGWTTKRPHVYVICDL